NVLHDVAPPAVSRNRKTPADHLAERGEVRPDAVQLLRAARRHAEPGHHFIENQQCAMLRGNGPQRLKKSRNRRNAPHIAANRLHNHRRDLCSMHLERALQRLHIIEGQGNGMSLKPFGTPGESGSPSVATPDPAFTRSESTWP